MHSSAILAVADACSVRSSFLIIVQQRFRVSNISQPRFSVVQHMLMHLQHGLACAEAWLKRSAFVSHLQPCFSIAQQLLMQVSTFVNSANIASALVNMCEHLSRLSTLVSICQHASAFSSSLNVCWTFFPLHSMISIFNSALISFNSCWRNLQHL